MGGVDLSVSGSSVTANMWTVDGANNNDVGSNRTILVYPSAEAIEEFKIHRNSYGAEFGQAAGAQINIVTRRGSNTLHGSRSASSIRSSALRSLVRLTRLGFWLSGRRRTRIPTRPKISAC